MISCFRQSRPAALVCFGCCRLVLALAMTLPRFLACKAATWAVRRFTDEFKQDAVAQVVERGYAVSEVAERLGASAQLSIELATCSRRYS
jgi:hypothetical protein